jgi:hypothetical protein
LGLPFTARSGSAFQVDPENPAVDHLKIDMPATYLGMFENHIRSRVAADYRKWLM